MPALSLRVWAIYEFAIGLGLLILPTGIVGLFGIPGPQEVWIRVVGAIAISIGVYYWFAARDGAPWFGRASVVARLLLALLLAVLAVTTGPWQLLLFAAVLVAGAMWTGVALRSS